MSSSPGLQEYVRFLFLTLATAIVTFCCWKMGSCQCHDNTS